MVKEPEKIERIEAAAKVADAGMAAAVKAARPGVTESQIKRRVWARQERGARL